ncbi:Cyclic nucleotide-gated channel cone photoreceptor subunit alpha [Phytophthora citrophthora]|uniref:Cyclic nucleotide-gated channel cone photoreceptor subunit alpha n=1 Tax=Phytophthora citrophthora TaxID=4793 RepID=A0AAD9GQZ3_9STRA|nr:Cyclic nucleotide-gated channel cone photoreceptor subunit alpha [Phytophthora citrophthora]
MARRRRLSTDNAGSGSFYGYLGELRNAFDPHSGLLKSWHQILFGCLLYEAFLLPFAVTFVTETSQDQLTTSFRVFYAVELLFLADFYVQLNTGFYEGGNIHRDKRQSRVKYVKSVGFLLDVVAIIPMSIIISSSSTLLTAYWYEFHKILRIWRIPGYLSNLDDVYAKHFRALKSVKVLVAIVLVAHVVACCRFAFGWSDTDAWLPPSSLKDESMSMQYVQALFWSVGLLTSGFEGGLPRHNSEFAFTLAVILVGFILFIYACSTLFMLSKSESNQSVLAQARINQLRHLLTFHRVPELLQTQAVEYLKRHYTDAESNDREVVKLLCPSITKDIQVELLKDMVGRIPLFRGCNQQFIVALTSLLEMTSFPANVTLFEAGDRGDFMYVVNSGVLHILVNGRKVRELRQGSFFGEVSVFSQRPRSAAVVTTSYCTLYRLSRFHTERVLEGYPDYALQIAATIDAMLEESEERKSRSRGSRGGGEEFMLTTLFHLTTKPPKKRASLRDRAKNAAKAKVSLSRSKSTRVLSASRHAEYDGGNISMNENRALNFNPAPINLPPKVIIKKPTGTLVRSQSVYARRVSSGTTWWTHRATSAKSSSNTRVDTMQGFYDNLSRHRGSQQLAGNVLSRVSRRFLLRRVIDHTSQWRKHWLIILQVHLAANCYVITLLLSFSILDCPMINAGVHAGYIILDIILLVDIYFNFHLSYTDKQKKVVDPSLIAKRYLRGAFVADFLCIIPYRFLIPLSSSSVLMTHPALLRLPQLLRIWRVKGHVKEWESSFRLSSTGWIFISGVTCLLLLHLVACIYFSLTYVEGFGIGDSWLPSSELAVKLCMDSTSGVMYYASSHTNSSYTPSEAHAVAGVQYARSLYFGATMLTTLGRTVEPSSHSQYSVALILMLCGFLSLAVMINTVQKRLTASAFEQKEFLVTRTRVQRFITSRTVPPGVHQRVKSFLEFWWSSHRGAVIGDLLNELPETIKRPILRSICQPALRTLSLLPNVRSSLDALEEVFIDNVRFILYGQGEIIYRQGDYASGLFFLLEGELIIIVNGGVPRTIVKGGFIGSAALNLNETSVSYAERVTTASGCILLFISRNHLDGMHKVFPTFSMALRALEKRLEGTKLARAQQDYSSRERSFSGGLRPLPDLKKLTFEMKVLKVLGLEDLIFDPDDLSSEIWAIWIFGLTIALYLKVVGDISTGVEINDAVGSETVAVILEFFFALDFYFHSRLGYYEYGNKIMDIFPIRKEFVRSRQVWCEALALVPLYTINWMLGSVNRYELLSINKILRLLRATETFMKLEEKHLSWTLRLRLIKLILLSYLLSHLFGSVWFNFKSSSSSWIPSPDLKNADKNVQYSGLLFWAFGLMSNSFTGELPKTVAECCFTVVVLLTGASFFAYVVGNISDVVELIDANSRDFNAKLSSLRHLLGHFHLPQSIEQQLKTYFFFQQYHTITQEYLLERCLPPSLLTEIRLVHLHPMIVKVGFLAGMEGSVTRMLVSQFVQALTVKDQYVFHLGEEGSDMFFVFTGIIEVLVPVETVHRRKSQETDFHTLGSPTRSSFRTFFPTMDPSKLQAKNHLKKVNELTSGSYFGEVSLFTSMPRSAHTRCRTSCVLYRLSRRSLELVFERYPEWKRKVLKIVNIQQEQQLLRNMYMEEQMDNAVNVSKKMLNHADILGAATNGGATNRSTSSSADSFSERPASSPRRRTRSLSRPLGSISAIKRNGSFFSSYKAQRSVLTESAIGLQAPQPKSSVLWVDLLLQCTDAQSVFHVQWLRIIAVGTIYMALVIPYRNSYDLLERLSPLPIVTRVLELTCELLFGWDIWVNWNLKDGLESMELYESRQREAYQKERLWIDIISAIPIDHFLSDFYQSPLLNLNRCLKLFNFPHYMREINRRSVAYEQNRLCTLWILLFVLMHWCACVYFSIASATRNEGDPGWDNWAPPQSSLTISWENPSLNLLMFRFLRGIFFASTVILKKGKVFEPTYYSEYTFTLFVDFVGVVAVAFMIGEMANLYVSYISNEVEFRKNHIAVDLYLERWHITGKLRDRSQAFLSSLWSSHRGVNYQAIFDEIPQVIRTESIMQIAYLPLRVFINNVFRPFATNHPHDRDVEAITRAIAQRLKYEGYPRDEKVLVEGSVSKEMYFVVKGHLMSISEEESEQSEQHYKKGDYFGEHGLLGFSVGVSTVKTISACDLLSLSSEDLLEVVLSRPLFQVALSIAVEGYRELCKRSRLKRTFLPQVESTAKPEEEWGDVLYRILSVRKKQWLEEALLFNTGDGEDPVNEPWTVSIMKAGQEAGMVSISSPSACVNVFEKLVRLIATRGLLDTTNLHQTAAQFQSTLPIMTADLSTHRSANMSATEKSDSSKVSGSKLSYLH